MKQTYSQSLSLLIIFFLFSLSPQTGFLPFAQDQEAIPMDPSVRTGTLDNGMTFYLKQNAKPENRVELRLALKAGSMQEDEDQLGLAHFIEHMAFNGTRNFSKNELVDYLESVGTRFGPDLNAYTSFDETVYMLQVRSDEPDNLDKGLTVMEDWAGGIMFDPEEVDKERGVVISEWRSRLSADQRMQQQYFPIMYYNSRYAKRLPIGDPDIVQNAHYDVIKRFYKDWYRTDLMAVIAVGDMDLDMMEKEIKSRFSDIPASETKRTKESNEIPMHEETFITILQDKEESFTRVRWMIKHPHIPVKTQADYRESLARSLYNRMLNARLGEISREADPPFIFAGSGYGSNVGELDTYSSNAMTPEGKVLVGFEAIIRENMRALQHGFQQTEMDRQKEEMMRFMEKTVKESDKTQSGRLASRLVYRFLRESPTPSPEQQMALYQRYLDGIQISEINELPGKFLTDENTVIVVTGPEKEGVLMPTEKEVRSVLEKYKSVTLEPYVDAVIDEPLMERELKPVAISKEERMEDLGIVKWTLPNGVQVMAKQTDFKNDEINMSAYSPGGHSLYENAKYHSASNATQIINQSGLRIFDMNAMNRLLTGKTVSVSPYISELYEGLNGSCSPRDAETMFELIYLYFTAPRVDEIAFEGFIKKQKGIYGNLMVNPNFWFSDQVSKIRYQDHFRRGMPKMEDLDKISLQEVEQIYKDRFADAGDFVFFFVGSFEEEILKEQVSKYLGNLPTMGRQENWKDIGVNYPTGRIEKELSKGEAPRSMINMIYHGDFEWNDWNRYVMRSLIDLSKIKLREAMREDKGGVYGVNMYGGASKIPETRYSITISFNSDPPRTDELIKAAFDVLEKIKTEGVSEKDLQKVKETQKQSRIKDLENNRFWQRQMQSSQMNDTDLNNLKLETLEKWIGKLTAEDIQQAAAKYFNDGEFIKVVMHPEKVVEN